MTITEELLFYYKDNNNFLIQSLKEINTPTLISLTKEEYLELLIASASEEAKLMAEATAQTVENIWTMSQ